MGLPQTLTSVLADYLDEVEDGEAALHRAAEAVRAASDLDIAALFDWIRTFPAASAQRRARASAVLRAALNLPLIPGPVCRTP